MLSRVHSTHACTLHACAVVELRFVTERKKNKNKNKNGAEFIPRAFPSESQSNKVVFMSDGFKTSKVTQFAKYYKIKECIIVSY